MSSSIGTQGGGVSGMTFYVYILEYADGSYYTGQTNDLENRVNEHQAGKREGYTKSRRPITLRWSQDFSTRVEAMEAERQIKGWSRSKREALMSEDFGLISELAKKQDWVGYASLNP